MRCPFCAANKDKVIDSRASEGGASIRRRRQCLVCGKRFTTYEHVEENTRLTVVKRDGSRVPFDRDKMLAGLQAACYKRPVPSKVLNTAVEEIETHFQKTGEREIDALDIGQRLAEKLKQIDHIAYVRFASVYKQFRDIDDMLEEVRDVIENSDPRQGPDQGQLF